MGDCVLQSAPCLRSPAVTDSHLSGSLPHIVCREQIGVNIIDKIAIAVLQRFFHSGSRRVFQNDALGRHNHPAL